MSIHWLPVFGRLIEEAGSVVRSVSARDSPGSLRPSLTMVLTSPAVLTREIVSVWMRLGSVAEAGARKWTATCP